MDTINYDTSLINVQAERELTLQEQYNSLDKLLSTNGFSEERITDLFTCLGRMSFEDQEDIIAEIQAAELVRADAVQKELNSIIDRILSA